MVIVNLSIFAQISKAQEMSKDGLERTLFVEFGKSKYFLLEPISAKFRLRIPSTDGMRKILKGISIKISIDGKSKVYSSLTTNISQGEPQPLPGASNIGQVTSGELRYCNYEEEELMNRVGEFFPKSGDYQVQFFLGGVKWIDSNIINLTIEEPREINKEAFDFLSKYENATSFDWVWKEKNGEALLEEFVNKYGESVYGESAISYIGNIYLAKGEFDKAKIEFEKIKSSENSILAKEANKSLADIAQKKVDLQKTQNQKEKP